jgi:hypothetical protein
MEGLFDAQTLRVRQPGKLLPDRAKYEIFTGDRRLLAVVTETVGHTRLKLLTKVMPDTRIFEITTAAGQPVLSLVKQTSEWLTELRGPEGKLIGRIRTEGTRRHYTLLDDQDKTVGRAVGDLALKRFSVSGDRDGEFARVTKTWAGLTKEVLTDSDHYKVDFTGPVDAPARTLTVMIPVVLDLTLYGPV